MGYEGLHLAVISALNLLLGHGQHHLQICFLKSQSPSSIHNPNAYCGGISEH